MITDLLPRYYEANGDDVTYTILRSIVVDGHETAFMQFDGKVLHDITGQGREGESFTGRAIKCECDFSEGVGWEVKEGRRYTLKGKDTCIYRDSAVHLRHLELRAEYLERFRSDDPFMGGEFALMDNVQAIILDLIEKVKAGEFIGEYSNGAEFWGGYFYLQTVAEITGQFVGHLWRDVYALAKSKKIGLDGAVIQPYREPPPPEWEEFAKLEVDGWVGVASLPGNRSMARQWKIDVFDPDGNEAVKHPGLGLHHDPVFGPDVEDVARAEQEIRELIAELRKHREEAGV